MPAKFELIAPCFFGCEATAKFELTRIGAENIRVGDGRLTFAGGPEMIAAANLNLRTAERVLLLLATYKATTFDELFDGCYNIAWEDLLPANAAIGDLDVLCAQTLDLKIQRRLRAEKAGRDHGIKCRHRCPFLLMCRLFCRGEHCSPAGGQ